MMLLKYTTPAVKKQANNTGTAHHWHCDVRNLMVVLSMSS